ncbi:MAG: transglutaminase domain-containing protein [Syntrophaceae bacterium]|nr:transglutaminase domain-containing protein [Syntrophaceae bacterium]
MSPDLSPEGGSPRSSFLARWPWVVGALALAVFVILLAVRMDWLPRAFKPAGIQEGQAGSLVERDLWMSILQSGRKIGYTHRVTLSSPGGWKVREDVSMRINTMGYPQSITFRTSGDLHPDLTLKAFTFDLQSSLFRFSARGSVEGDSLVVTSGPPGEEKGARFSLQSAPRLSAGILEAVWAARLGEGESRTFQVFDPVAMGQRPVTVTAGGEEAVVIQGTRYKARKYDVDFMGARQTAWIGEKGDVLREVGVLGISLERTTREQALAGLASDASADLTEVASVASNLTLKNPAGLTRLRIRLTGADVPNLALNGDRQHFEDGIVTVTKESPQPAGKSERAFVVQGAYLGSNPFIQSDDRQILDQAGRIAAFTEPDYIKALKIVYWVFRNIEKKPVLSVPNALETLQNRVGDCNEHAVLVAALGRASGIPTIVEAGLVYQRGRFYYHAWNAFYIRDWGKWVTADAVFNQLPADVTHLRLVRGDMDRQMDLLGLIGRLRLEILAAS